MGRNKIVQVAIDGPAAAGKSTVAKLIADRLNYVYIDTGAMYRALTLKAYNKGINVHDGEALENLLKETEIVLQTNQGNQTVLMDGEDVTQAIRQKEVNENVSFVSQHAPVRALMVDRQKKLAESANVVMDGRDIGTHVLPRADVKVFLRASVSERAERRYKEQVAKGMTTSLKELEQEIALRDKRDSEREVSPLVKAEDAVEIDTTSLSIEQVTDKILSLIKGADPCDAL
ncbi:MAG TPA: (d)CMP kinase [Sporolactobacillaceae bacterium]|nr:(d)CMP kinase [Sporolactobacillaceae bacterium]